MLTSYSRSSILLRWQHAQLDSSDFECITSCAPHRHVLTGLELNRVHAVKTVQAAADITKLIALPTSLIKHTQFFACAVTVAAIVHLSCWSAATSESQDYDLIQQVHMDIGGLKAMARIWPSAGMVLGRVSRVAQEIFATRTTAANSGSWGNLTGDERLRNFFETESVTDDFPFS